MSGDNRTEESFVELLVLRVMRDGNVWENSEIKKALTTSHYWTSADRQLSASRGSEPMWHSSVNNVLTAKRGLYKRGLVQKHRDGAHKITRAGLCELERHDALSRSFSQSLREAGFDELNAQVDQIGR